MRFYRLDIPSFGPFTGLELSFPGPENDLHVIYGGNEAGKSSLLRAIRDLLFGIHGQSGDAFLHNYSKMLLKAGIENRAGNRLDFQRRKGNRNTLLDADGKALPDTALQPFLGMVSQSYFSTMFGLGSSELRDGSQQLLEGKGEIGQALFSASLGGTPVQRVLDSLEEESGRIFKKPSAARSSIRSGAARYQELNASYKASVVAPGTWDQLTRALEENGSLKSRLENEIAGLEGDAAWIQRCEDALPIIGRLNEERLLLEALPVLPEVASDFGERARAARDQVRETAARVQTLTALIERLKVQLSECVRFPEIMAVENALDVLHQEFGSYCTRREELNGQLAQLAGLEARLRAGMADLQIQGELESLEAMRPGIASRLACEEAAGALTRAQSLSRESRGRVDALKRLIAEQHQELQSLPETDPEKLREALSVAEGAAEAARTLEAGRAALQGLEQAVADARARIRDIPEDLELATRLPVPSPNGIRIFRERLAGLEGDRRRVVLQIRDELETVANLQRELERLGRRGELPTEESLRAARAHRDHGWQLVLAEWKGPGTSEKLDPALPLEEAFPRAVEKADGIADRLRREADAVAQAEEKRLSLEDGQRRIETRRAVLAGLEAEIQTCQGEWGAAWEASGIRPRSPQEMEEWRDDWARLGGIVSQWRDARAEVESKSQRIEQARSVLAAALEESGDKAFSVLYDTAKIRVRQAEENSGRRMAMAEQQANRSRELETLIPESARLDGDLEAARAAWEVQRRALGLPEHISAESGVSLLQERRALLSLFDDWQQRGCEAAAVQEAVRQYENRVQAMGARLGFEAGEAVTLEPLLWRALSEARRAQTSHDQLAGQIAEASAELQAATQAAALAMSHLQELLNAAGLAGAEELEPFIASVEKRTEIQGHLKNLRETLSGLARGSGVDEFIAGVQRENPQEIPGRRAGLERLLTAKRAALQEVHTTLQDLKRQQSGLEQAGDAAADFSQQAQSVAATLKQEAQRFIRLRLATHFLSTRIERFREENQGPLLEKSGQFFAAMTRGSFAGLDTEFDKGVPVMLGRRPDRSTVSVAGMSEGTRDQLYLALRLAALDRHLEGHEPMPLILDDLLSTFDDDRARAILTQLAAFSGRTQIFLFTHHAHLVELCRQTLGAGAFTLHDLPGTLAADANRP